MHAISATTGKMLWSLQLPHLFTPLSLSPDERTIYVGGSQTNDLDSYAGALFAIDSVTGVLLWQFNTTETVYTNPTIGRDGLIYLPTRNSSRSLRCLGPDGEQRWNYTFEGPGSMAAPTISEDGTLFVQYSPGHVGKIFAFD